MRKQMCRLLKTVVVAMLVSTCGSAIAANWDNGGVGDSWMNPTNWSSNLLPTAGDATYLDNSDTAVLYSGDTGASGPLFVQGTSGGTAQVTLQGTLTTSSYCKLADLATQSGIVTVDGGTWNVQNYLYAGRNGTGKLVVTNGGTVNQTVSDYGLLISAGGRMELVDGTVSTLNLRIDSGGLIQMGDGSTIVVDGNEATEIGGWVTSEWIVSINPLATITVNYDGADTIVQAVVPVPTAVALDFGGGADYGSSWVNANDTPTESTVDADFDGNADDQMLSIAFGTTYSPMDTVTTPAGMSGPGMKYGMSLANIDTNLTPVMSYNRFSPNDYSQIDGADQAGDRRMATVWYYEKSDFLNGADQSDNLSFANEDGSLVFASNLSGTPASGYMRGAAFIAQSDGQWYITTLISAGYTTVYSNNAATANWYAFDPAADTLFFDRSDYGVSVLGSTLTNITALGMYAQTGLTSGNLYQGVKQLKAVLEFVPVVPPHEGVYEDNYNTIGLWHMDAVRDQEFVDDDDSVYLNRNADLTVLPNPNTTGPTLIDPAVTAGLDYPADNADFGNCLYLDNIQSAETNTAQYLRIPNADLAIDPTHLRIEGWSKPDVAFDNQILVDRWSQIVVYARDDGFTVLRWDADGGAAWKNATPAGFVATNWNHFAVEATSSNLLIYVNGNLESDTDLAGGGLAAAPSHPDTYIGCRYNTDAAFKGYVDEFRIFNTGETITETLRAFDVPQALVTPVIDGLVGSSEWSDSKTLDLVYPTLMTLPNVGAVAGDSADMNPEDISGSFNYKWDADYLYFSFEITDDVHIGSGYPDDHLLFGFNPSITNTVWDNTLTFEMFVDGSGTAQTAIYKDGLGTLSLASSGFAGSTDGSNWNFEAKLKWTEIMNDVGYVPATNDQFGTALLLCDNDVDDGVRDAFLYSIGGGAVMTTPAGWHTVTLAGDISVPAVPYAEWISDYSVGSQTNLTDDFDGDLMDNLVEYGLGGNPEIDDAADILPVSYMDAASNLFAYVYSRRLGADILGLTYTVERDTDLVATPEGWTTNGVTEASAVIISPEFEAVTTTVPADVDGRFLRLQIEQAE